MSVDSRFMHFQHPYVLQLHSVVHVDEPVTALPLHQAERICLGEPLMKLHVYRAFIPFLGDTD